MLRTDVPVFDLATRGPHRVRREGADGRARPALRHVRRRGAECDPRPDASLPDRLAGRDGRLPSRLRKASSGRRPRAELTQWAQLEPGGEELARPGALAARRERRRGVLPPHLGRAVGGRERDHRRQAGLRNTTLSVHASGEFTIRLAPGQDVETIGAAARKSAARNDPGGRRRRSLGGVAARARAPRRAGGPALASTRSSVRSASDRCSSGPAGRCRSSRRSPDKERRRSSPASPCRSRTCTRRTADAGASAREGRREHVRELYRSFAGLPTRRKAAQCECTGCGEPVVPELAHWRR